MEMELTSLLLTKEMPEVARYLAQTSNSPEERRNFNSAILTRDPFNIGRVESLNVPSITSKIVKTELTALGIDMVDNSKEENDNNNESK